MEDISLEVRDLEGMMQAEVRGPRGMRMMAVAMAMAMAVGVRMGEVR